MFKSEGRPSIVIANGGTNSTVIPEGTVKYARAIAIQAPAALTGTVTLQGTLDGTTWAAVVSGGSPVTIAAGQILVVEPVPFMQLRLQSGAAEGAERTFQIRILRDG